MAQPSGFETDGRGGTNFYAGVSGTYRADWSFWTELNPGQEIDMFLKKNGRPFPETDFVAKRGAEGSGTDNETTGLWREVSSSIWIRASTLTYRPKQKMRPVSMLSPCV